MVDLERTRHAAAWPHAPIVASRRAARAGMALPTKREFYSGLAVLMVCGTPDECYKQIADFTEYCGGLGNLLVMAQGGHLDHKDTCDSLTLLAKEIMPRLKEMKQPQPAQKIAAA